MFTGLIEEIGRLDNVERTEAGVELRIGTSWNDLIQGESISVNGVCLTVRETGPGWFTVAAAAMTVDRTTVEDWEPGKLLHLERAMRADTRLGGHFVQGHVDGVGVVKKVKQKGDALLVDVKLPKGLAETLVLHGSVTLDGVSLTVNDLEGDKLQVALVEYTLSHSSLGELEKGSRVNVETDVIGKYVQRLVAPYRKR